MPYHDEEYPGQPLWQSVLLFCCKGMIEGIVVILFLWLLVQVLFTKQLEDSSRSSLSSFPKLALLARTRKALQRRCTVNEDRTSYDEHSRLTSPSAVHENEKPIPLAPLSYGSSASCQLPASVQNRLDPEAQSLVLQLTVLISQDALICKRLSCPPQIFILLHYQTPEHFIKATVLRAENLSCLAPTSEAADYQVVVNLHHGRVLISSRETQRESYTVWNTSFLFDLPVGDISQLTLTLEFEVVQTVGLSEGQVIGRVLIGADAADAGRAHWRDMCSLLVEQARWHIVHPELL
ncbi:uncharacterized protein LOC114464214 [Gouania willdenowi]|uniref:uncharacterized protein LOC114464214 n=1 Tax=Gouania willdenowi TaxID=441366 RepID=UPI0010557FCC|nr:uncharacterized protein LOC114464214 [Gouania willdenowi]